MIENQTNLNTLLKEKVGVWESSEIKLDILPCIFAAMQRGKTLKGT